MAFDLSKVPSSDDEEQSSADLSRIPSTGFEPPPPAPKQTISDYAKRFAAGAADAFLTSPGAIVESVGGPSKFRQSGQALSERISDTLSPQAKAIDQAPLFDGDWNLHPNPGQKIASGVAGSAPSLIQAFVTGRPVQQAMSRADVAGNVAAQAARLGVPAKAGKVIGNAVEALPFAAVEGAASGGMAAADVMGKIEQATPEQLRASPRFNELLVGTDPSLPAEQREALAREALMGEAGRSAGLNTGAWTGGVGFLTGGGALGPIARRLSGKSDVADGFVKSALKDAAKEAGQEAPQSAGEQYFGNVATRDYLDPTQSAWENVGQAGAEGAAVGFALGGGAGAATFRRGADGQPPEEAVPMAPPVDPSGPLGAAVVAGQQSGAIPTNPVGGPVDAPDQGAGAPGGGPAPGGDGGPAPSDPRQSALAELARVASKVPPGTAIPPESALGKAALAAIDQATAAGASEQDVVAALSGQAPQPSEFQQRQAWKSLAEVEAFLSQSRHQSPQAPAARPVQREDGQFTFALPGEPEYDTLPDARQAPDAQVERQRQDDERLARVESLTKRLAQTNAAAQKAREAGDEETVANADAVAGMLRDRLEVARRDVGPTQGAGDAGTGVGGVPGADLGTAVQPSDGRPGGAGDQAGRALAGGGGVAGDAGLPRPEGGDAAPQSLAAPAGDGGGARPVVLQNRDRSGVASVTQMQSIAANPDPRRLSFSRDFGSGAPVVFSNFDEARLVDAQLGREDTITDSQGRQYAIQYAVIEADEVVASNAADGTPNDLYEDSDTPGLIRAVAGNGRMAGLQEAFRRGTAAGYAQGIAADTALHGIDPAVIDAMSNPVLVRIMRADDVTPDIGDRSNVSGAARLNPVEQARTDMARVNLDALDFTEAGDPTTAAVKAFVAGMPEAERSELMTRDGAAGRQAIDRLMAATFAKAYGDERLVELYAQATDPDARNVLSAMAQAAGAMARLEGMGDLDVRPLVIDAANMAVNAARNGVSLAKFVQTPDITLAPEVRPIAETLAANARSAKRMAEALRSLADLAYSEATKESADMFGEVPRRTRGQVIEEIFGGQGREGGADAVQNAGRAGLDEAGAAGQGDAPGQREPAGDAGQSQGEGSDRPADGQDDAFGLTSYTLDELAQRDAELEQTQADQQAEQGRRAAAPPADDFVLSGSDRAADLATARGQMELGGEAPVDAAAAQAATSPKNDLPEPTDAQKDAGNYQKGHVRIAGLGIAIENEAGTRRRPEWPPLAAHYGYVKRTEGADGDQVDVFIKPGTPEDFDGPVFVIDQHVDGKFDEHKVMLGWGAQPAAAKAYRDNYTKGWKGLNAIRRMTMDEFKAWLRDGDTTAPAQAPTGPIEDVGEKIGGARKDTSTPTGPRGTKQTDDRPGWRKRYSVSQIAASSRLSEVGRWTIHDERVKDRLGQAKQVGRDSYATKEEAEAAIPLAEVARNHRAVPASTKQGESTVYEIVRDVTDRKRVKVVDQQFATREDALRYMIEHAVEIIETKTSFGEEILPTPETVMRKGSPRRTADAVGEDFQRAFGFRGVEFGNWNNQAERQEVMNHAYDGLMDLAEVLGIPPKAIGLDGELALAFGARGNGLSGARAHYEPDYAVINLTKMHGAGSLAHEWLHAVDHYFARQDGKAKSARVKNKRGDDVFPTQGTEQAMASHGFGYKSAVRQEVRDAYKAVIETMYRKAEQFVEDTQRADRFVANARKDVQTRLDSIRQDLAEQKDPRYWKRKNAPASAEQLAAFDDLARKIVDGEMLETTPIPVKPASTRKTLGSIRWSNDALERISTILKDVRGRGGFDATNQSGVLDRLRQEMSNYSQRLKMLADAQSAEVKSRKVPTEYAMAAKSIDQGRASDYWSTPHEMAARAFQSYVLDKIAEQGGASDFLTYGPESAVVPTPWGWKRPFPAGAERKEINAAFDALFATIQTRETDRGVAIFEPGAQYSVGAPRRGARAPADDQADLFSAPVPQASRDERAAGPDFPRVPGDVQPAVTIQDTPAPQGEYLVRTIVGVETRRTLGAARIASAEDAAKATKYLYRHAVERFDAIVTDADGKPLAVVGGFKGALSQAAVYPATLVTEAVRVPGAARIWFSHNHPSGTAELSSADRNLNSALARVFKGSGIEPMGLLAIAGDKFAFQGVSDSGFTNLGEDRAAIPAPDAKVEVPVVERMLGDPGIRRPSIDSPAVARDTGKGFYDRAKVPGMMLLDTQNRVAAWVPLSQDMLGALRGTGGLGALYRAVSESNSGGAILVHGGELDAQPKVQHVTAAQNIGAALAAVDARVLDVINVSTGESLAERGHSLADGPVFSRGSVATTLPAAGVRSIADAVRRAWANAPDVVVVGDLQDLQVPQRVRQYDAEQRSQGATGEPEGFFYQGKVYLVASQMSTPADVVRVLSHEALGHYGLRGYFGTGLGKVLDQVAVVRRADVTAKLQEYGLPDTAQGRRVAAEEVLAVMAQTNPQLGFVRRAVAAIRAWLRGLGVPLYLTDADIVAQFILPARAWVQRGGVSGDGMGAAFSRRAAPTWYSPLARAIDKINAKAQPASAWLQQINALTTKGVKAEEIEWSGIREYLALQQGRVPKAAVQSFVEANGVRVEEAVLADAASDVAKVNRALAGTGYSAELDNVSGDASFIDPDGDLVDFGELPADVQEIVQRATGAADGTTKFGQYVLPGGENYREVLLTLPERPKLPDGWKAVRVGDLGPLQPWDEGKADWYTALDPDGLRTATMPTEAEAIHYAAGHANTATRFLSSHWQGHPNVLAHIRLNDRTDADGRRVLFVEELQSDWAQLRRKNLRMAAASGSEMVRAGADLRTPPAPFIEKTDAWVALALKRIVKMAVDEGYDRVAFVTGEQAADRFDLSKQIDRIRYAKSDGGTLTIDAIKGDRFVFSKANMPMSELEEIVGKEVAQRIADDAGTTDPITGYQELAGLDLKVGGEGMRAFYDRIVPTVMKDVLRKVGGGKMVTVGFSADPNPALDLWEPEDGPGDGSRAPVEKFSQPGFDITAQMRDAAAEGMPLFSRRPTVEGVQAAVGQAAQAIRGATLAGTWQRVVNTWTDVKPLSLQFLGRRQIVDVYGNLLPQLTDYSNRMQQYDADKHESAAAADEVVRKWRRLPDADRLADVMHGATLAGYDPDASKTPADMLTPEMREVYDGFVGLSPDAKALYREARDAYRAHWNAVKAAIGERIERADIAENDRRALMEKYRDQFLKPIEGVYFPLARFGDYVITAMDAEGNKVVAFAETMTQAQAEQARLGRDYQDVSKITRRREYNAARDSVSKEFVRQLFTTIDKSSVDGQQADMLKDAVNQLYLTSLPDVSWAKHGVHRRGVAGYSKDARRAFAANMFHGGYHLAKLRHADVLQDYLRDMQEHVEAQRANAAYDSVTGQQVVDEMVKRHDTTMNPDNNPWANTLTGLGFVWFLGLSPASAIVNLSQTALVAYPVIAARYGYGATADALTRASKETLQHRNDLRGKLTPDENGAVERAVREGLVDITQAHDLAGVAEGRDSGLQSRFSPVMRAASWMFHQAEKFNRQATFIAAYRLARGKGKTSEAAYEIARDLTYKGHFDYAASNRPSVMMGPVARVALLFKQYGQNMIYTLTRNALLAARGDREALKALSGVLVGHGLAAGALGLPLASVLLGAASLIGTALSGDDEPWDAEVALRNYLADWVGPTLGEILSRGVFRAIFPGDIASRVGLDSLLIRDIDLTLDPNKIWQELINAVLGPIAGIGMNVTFGAGDLARGDLLRGIQGMVPKAIGDGFKALRYWTDDGVKDRTGVDVLDDVTAADLVAQVTGFTPARVSEAYAGRRAIMGKKRAIDQRRESLLRDFSTGVIDGNHEKRLRALQEIQHFNQANPTVPITSQSMLRSIQNRMRRQAEASNGVYLPRRQRDLEQEGRFANVN